MRSGCQDGSHHRRRRVTAGRGPHGAARPQECHAALGRKATRPPPPAGRCCRHLDVHPACHKTVAGSAQQPVPLTGPWPLPRDLTTRGELATGLQLRPRGTTRTKQVWGLQAVQTNPRVVARGPQTLHPKENLQTAQLMFAWTFLYRVPHLLTCLLSHICIS